MGVPPEDWDLMFTLTNRVLGADDPEYQTVTGDAQETANQGLREMFGYCGRLVTARRAAPRDDLISVLTGAELEGEALTEEEILYFCYLLIVAGNETTRNAISGGMLALCEHPAERARLAADAALLPTAIEEIFRWTSPVLHMARYVMRDTVLHGQAIRAGERVLLWYPSARHGRDPAGAATGPRPGRAGRAVALGLHRWHQAHAGPLHRACTSGREGRVNVTADS